MYYVTWAVETCAMGDPRSDLMRLAQFCQMAQTFRFPRPMTVDSDVDESQLSDIGEALAPRR